jgi:hypothetical protein
MDEFYVKLFKSLNPLSMGLGVSIIDPTRRVNSTQHDPKINGSSMGLIFFTRIGSGRIGFGST